MFNEYFIEMRITRRKKVKKNGWQSRIPNSDDDRGGINAYLYSFRRKSDVEEYL